MALNLQIEVMSVREEREQAERDLEAQLEKLKAELTDTQQNADIMREALQVSRYTETSMRQTLSQQLAKSSIT